jgi:hypothetical protein
VGGGIRKESNLTLTASTVSACGAYADADSNAAGDGIYNAAGSSIQLVRCTLYGNLAQGGSPSIPDRLDLVSGAPCGTVQGPWRRCRTARSPETQLWVGLDHAFPHSAVRSATESGRGSAILAIWRSQPARSDRIPRCLTAAPLPAAESGASGTRRSSTASWPRTPVAFRPTQRAHLNPTDLILSAGAMAALASRRSAIRRTIEAPLDPKLGPLQDNLGPT